MNRRLKRFLAVLLPTAFLMLPAAADGLDQAAVPANLAALNEDVELERCLLTINFLYEPDAGRFSREGWLPDGYTPAEVANVAHPTESPVASNVNIWVFNCSSVRVGDSAAGAGMFSLVAIPVEGRTAHHHHPGMSDNYLVSVQTNRADLARAFEALGFPASVVDDMGFAWRRGPLNPSEGMTGVQVPWATSPYEVGIRGVPGTDTPHHHDNTFQHVRDGKKSTLQYAVLLPPGRDLLCVPRDRQPGADGWDGDPECGVKAAAGSDLARLLGDNPATSGFDPTTRTGLAADHEVIWKSRLMLTNAS